MKALVEINILDGNRNGLETTYKCGIVKPVTQ
jgi:hypothetical protein